MRRKIGVSGDGPLSGNQFERSLIAAARSPPPTLRSTSARYWRQTLPPTPVARDRSATCGTCIGRRQAWRDLIDVTREQADVAMIFPVASHGRPCPHHIPGNKFVTAETLLAGRHWRPGNWRRGTKGRLTARFAALRVRVASAAEVQALTAPTRRR